jgi:hypothetical protein
MKEKIDQLLQLAKNLLEKVKPFLISVDAKIGVLIPNPKLKKILYIGGGSLFGFMFLIIVLGLLFSPLKNKEQSQTETLNKPNIISVTPEPQKELTTTQKEILDLGVKTREMTFPESILNIPQIERDLSI